jgi:hypothetical protein
MPRTDSVTSKKILDELRYDSGHDMVMRLGKTLVVYEGNLVYLTEPAADLHMFGYTLTGKDRGLKQIIHSSDLGLDITSIRLGWANVMNRDGLPWGAYFMRRAGNSQKQGVDPGRLLAFDPRPEMMGNYRYRDYRDLYGFGEMFDEDYPSIGDAIEAIKKEGTARAIAFDWGLFPAQRKGACIATLYHKAVAVGWIDPKKPQIMCMPGLLSKTRRKSLEDLLASAKNGKDGYGVREL